MTSRKPASKPTGAASPQKTQDARGSASVPPVPHGSSSSKPIHPQQQGSSSTPPKTNGNLAGAGDAPPPHLGQVGQQEPRIPAEPRKQRGPRKQTKRAQVNKTPGSSKRPLGSLSLEPPSSPTSVSSSSATPRKRHASKDGNQGQKKSRVVGGLATPLAQGPSTSTDSAQGPSPTKSPAKTKHSDAQGCASSSPTRSSNSLTPGAPSSSTQAQSIALMPQQGPSTSPAQGPSTSTSGQGPSTSSAQGPSTSARGAPSIQVSDTGMCDIDVAYDST